MDDLPSSANPVLKVLHMPDQNLWQRRTLQAFLEKAAGTASVVMFVSCQQHKYSSEAGIPAEKMNIGSCTESMCVVLCRFKNLDGLES